MQSYLFDGASVDGLVSEFDNHLAELVVGELPVVVFVEGGEELVDLL